MHIRKTSLKRTKNSKNMKNTLTSLGYTGYLWNLFYGVYLNEPAHLQHLPSVLSLNRESSDILSSEETNLINSPRNEPRYEKTGFLHMRKQRRRSLRSITAQLISVFVFATRLVQSLYFINPKFQASSYLLWLYSLVCVGPGPKLRRAVFSERGSNIL